MKKATAISGSPPSFRLNNRQLCQRGGYLFWLLLPYFIMSIITSINVSTSITLIATHLQFWRKIQTAYRFMQSP